MRSPFKHLRNIRFRVPLMFQKCFSSLLSSISDKDVGELSNDLHLFGSNCYGTQPLSKEGDLTLIVRWNGKEYTLRNCTDDSVAESKRRICFLTNVLRKRQKLLYPKVGNKLSDYSLLLS
ncbi:hypothetical protein Bca52824_002499 [Brassica carinata]|uniref:Uncharacterized protein n=1 Tax=Brassica carinata TaxID=52824 RepID=A0A8X7WI70_BRACI|nr:hypothetical protein Bca52824_002499 [Brassica carinata]